MDVDQRIKNLSCSTAPAFTTSSRYVHMSALLRFSDIIFLFKIYIYISIFLLLYNNKCIIFSNNEMNCVLFSLSTTARLSFDLPLILIVYFFTYKHL